MATDFIEIAKGEIRSFLKENVSETKFTVKFNGEFFIAAAKGELSAGIGPCMLRAVSACEIRGNKIVFSPSDEWLEYVLSNIEEAEYTQKDLSVFSQIMRLNKQLEFGLCSGAWDERTHSLAKKILYFLHTKSLSIRRNIVKKCAQEYNIMQRHGKIPETFTAGYRNALCQISDKI